MLSNQVQLSLARVAPLADLVPYAASRGRVVIAWGPLGQGLLSARYDSAHPPRGAIRRMNPLFLEENLSRAGSLLGALRDVAAAHAATPAQVALAWLIHHPSVVVIPGASSVAQVEANAAAAEISLTDVEFTELTQQARINPVTGLRATWDAATRRSP